MGRNTHAVRRTSPTPWLNQSQTHGGGSSWSGGSTPWPRCSNSRTDGSTLSSVRHVRAGLSARHHARDEGAGAHGAPPGAPADLRVDRHRRHRSLAGTRHQPARLRHAGLRRSLRPTTDRGEPRHSHSSRGWWAVRRGFRLAACVAAAGRRRLLAIGVAATHYTSMAAVRVAGSIEYEPVRFVVSVGIAMTVACARTMVIAGAQRPARGGVRRPGHGRGRRRHALRRHVRGAGLRRPRSDGGQTAIVGVSAMLLVPPVILVGRGDRDALVLHGRHVHHPRSSCDLHHAREVVGDRAMDDRRGHRADRHTLRTPAQPHRRRRGGAKRGCPPGALRAHGPHQASRRCG